MREEQVWDPVGLGVEHGYAAVAPFMRPILPQKVQTSLVVLDLLLQLLNLAQLVISACGGFQVRIQK